MAARCSFTPSATPPRSPASRGWTGTNSTISSPASVQLTTSPDRFAPAMETLLPLAERAAELLQARGGTVAVAESSAGGLVCAALLSVPGASAYFRGGVVAYTRDARRALLGLSNEALDGVPPNSEPLAVLLAEAARERLG